MGVKEKNKIIILIGQTASGKTNTAIRLAKEIGGEVVSADSRQVYKHLNIGSDKITTDGMQGVRHHLIDIADPLTETYTVSDFIQDSTAAIKDIQARGKVPIVAGGTMLYIDALFGNILVPEVPPNPTLRAELEQHSSTSLFKELLLKDKRRAEQMKQEDQSGNKRRLIRALEIVEKLGHVPDSSDTQPTNTLLAENEVLWLGLHNDPVLQKEKINKRNAEMLDQGLLSEVKDLAARGVQQEQFNTFGFEYKYPAMYLSNIPIIKEEEPTIEQVLMKMNSGTWRYAKKQRAWWADREEINWFKPLEYEKLITRVNNFL